MRGGGAVREAERGRRAEARRILLTWTLSAWLERGVGRPRHHWQVARLERPLAPGELRQLLGPAAHVRFLPRPASR